MGADIGNGGPRVDSIAVSAYKVPTDQPEADGTIRWDSTTIVLVEAKAGDQTGIGWSYANYACARLIEDTLRAVVETRNAFSISGTWQEMKHALRNLGGPGISSMAISAVDTALWDLKARLLNLPLVDLFGAARDEVPIYGSGGFTSYSFERLRAQLSAWTTSGIPRVKMKIGSHPSDDLKRVSEARDAIGTKPELFVDANGAYSRKQALLQAERFIELGVSWFEEPVPSSDLAGLRLLRDRAPAGIEIAAGEYGYELGYFKQMLDAGAVDVLQADATRCGGFTGFLQAAAICSASGLELSAHCAPALHVHVCCAAPPVRHLEYFHDHVRIERIFFDGVLEPVSGMLQPDRSRPGIGLELKRRDIEQYAI